MLGINPDKVRYVIAEARMFDGKSNTITKPGLIVVSNGKIVGVGEGAAIPVGAEVIDLAGQLSLQELAALTARASFGPTLIMTCARTAPRPCSGPKRTPNPTMIPSRCSLSIRLCTLVRDRPTSLASCAVEARPFSRSASSNLSSMASMAIRRI